MRTHKLNLTRPEFLKHFICNDKGVISSFDDIDKAVPGSSNVIYACYTCLLNGDMESTDIEYVSTDGDSVVVKLTSKRLVQQIKETMDGEVIRLGMTMFRIDVKTKKSYLIVSLTEVGTYREHA